MAVLQDLLTKLTEAIVLCLAEFDRDTITGDDLLSFSGDGSGSDSLAIRNPEKRILN